MVRLTFTVAATLAALAVRISAECTRDGLFSAANSYIAAVTAGKTDGLKLDTSNFTYMENNKVKDIKTGILSSPLKIDLNRSTADTTQCASYTMFISTSGSKPYVVGTQMRHASNSTDTISMIDSVVASTGSLFFNASQTLAYIKKEDWSPAPAGKSVSRETLKKYGDGYLDMWTDAKAADSIQWGTDCERVEGSRLTRPCGASLPHGGSAKPNDNRRYVIDETINSVDVLCTFNSLGNWPDSHEIKVDENGKVKYVHTITVM